MTAETAILLAGMAAYLAACGLAVTAALRGRARQTGVAPLIGLALLLHGAAIALRWLRVGHGPYIDMFEVLSSNIWTLHAGLLVAVLLLPRLRPLFATALPVLQVMVLWLLSLEPADAPLPVTYATPWLAVHVWLGKVFLAIVLVAVAASLVILLRRWRGDGAFATLPASPVLDEVGFRLVLLAFVFECLMLAAGAAWAQDAWGRFWAWDPLETWSFLTWLAVGGYLHLRATWRPAPTVSATLVVMIFSIAFGTLFGIPFLSVAPHKGMV